MSDKWRILIIVTAILLIPILTGMTPVNFVQKIGAGCPFSQGKQTLKCSPCPFNSLSSHQDNLTVNLEAATLGQQDAPSPYGFILANSFTLSNNSSNPIPLRC